MPRKPNYDFDRRRKEQERKTKKENKRAERQQRRDERRVEDAPAPETTDEKRDVDLRLTVANRRVAADHATEFGGFQQSWTDSTGLRMTEFGRYVTFFLRERNGSWRMDRFFGFEDSTRSTK